MFYAGDAFCMERKPSHIFNVLFPALPAFSAHLLFLAYPPLKSNCYPEDAAMTKLSVTITGNNGAFTRSGTMHERLI